MLFFQNILTNPIISLLWRHHFGTLCYLIWHQVFLEIIKKVNILLICPGFCPFQKSNLRCVFLWVNWCAKQVSQVWEWKDKQSTHVYMSLLWGLHNICVLRCVGTKTKHNCLPFSYILISLQYTYTSITYLPLHKNKMFL